MSECRFSAMLLEEQVKLLEMELGLLQVRISQLKQTQDKLSGVLGDLVWVESVHEGGEEL